MDVTSPGAGAKAEGLVTKHLHVCFFKTDSVPPIKATHHLVTVSSVVVPGALLYALGEVEVSGKGT